MEQEKRLQEGDRVKICSSSRFYVGGPLSDNPMDVIGTVVKIYRTSSLGINVNWDNGRHNSYNQCDLIPFVEEDNYQVY